MEEELFIPKTKYKGLKIILATLLILGLAAGGYFLYQYKFNNARVIINKILDTTKSNINEAINTINKNDVYRINGHVKMKVTINGESSPISDVLNNLEIQFNGETDLKEKKAAYTINTKYHDEKLIDLKTYQEKKDVYILFEDLYDKYVKMKTDEIENESSNLSVNDIKIIYNALIESLQKGIEKAEVKQTDAKITVEGNEIEVINNYLELKDREVNNLVKNMIASLNNNKEFVNILTKIMGVDGKAYLEELNKGIDEDDFQGIYKISFYTDKGLLNKKLISIRQDITIEDTKISINIDVIGEDEMLLTITGNDITISLNLRANNSTFNLSISEVLDGGSVNADLNLNYEKIKEVTKPDISNYKEINDLTKEESDSINNKLMENQSLQKIIEEFRKTIQKEV